MHNQTRQGIYRWQDNGARTMRRAPHSNVTNAVMRRFRERRQVLVHSWHTPRCNALFIGAEQAISRGFLATQSVLIAVPVVLQEYTLQVQLKPKASPPITVAEQSLVLGEAESEPRPLPCTAPGTGARICSNQPKSSRRRAGARLSAR